MGAPRPLIILGTSGSALDVLDVVEAINSIRRTFHVAGFLDDGRPAGSEFAGLKVLGSLRDASRFVGHALFNAIGSDTSYLRRPEIKASTGVSDDSFATLMHPAASVSSRASLGYGVCVNHGASVGGGAVIGDHVWVGPGAVIGHDCTIGDQAILAPGAIISGFSQLGRCCYIGAGAALRQRVKIGDGALVGLGAVVLCDVPPNTVVVGNPARVLRQDGTPPPAAPAARG